MEDYKPELKIPGNRKGLPFGALFFYCWTVLGSIFSQNLFSACP